MIFCTSTQLFYCIYSLRFSLSLCPIIISTFSTCCISFWCQLWFHVKLHRPHSCLSRIIRSKQVHTILRDIHLSNTTCWSWKQTISDEGEWIKGSENEIEKNFLKKKWTKNARDISFQYTRKTCSPLLPIHLHCYRLFIACVCVLVWQCFPPIFTDWNY